MADQTDTGRFDQLDKVLNIFRRVGWTHVSISQAASVYQIIVEYNSKSDPLIQQQLWNRCMKKIVDCDTKHLSFEDMRRLVHRLHRFDLTLTSAGRDNLTDQFVDAFFKSKGTSLEKDSLFALEIAKWSLPTPSSPSSPVSPVSASNPLLSIEDRLCGCFHKLLTEEHHTVDEDIDDMINESLDRRGYLLSINFFDLALDTHRIVGTSDNSMAICTWLSSKLNVDDDELIRIVERIVTELPFSIDDIVFPLIDDQDADDCYLRALRCIIIVAGSSALEHCKPFIDPKENEKRVSDQFLQDAMIEHKSYWDSRLRALMDKPVNLPRCLAELVISYLKVQVT